MKFFHLSDLHIGKQLHLYSLKEDQERILKEIVSYVKDRKPQAIVIAGDIYDKSVPSAEAVAVFNGFLKEVWEQGCEVLLVSGNHDSPERLDFGSFLLEKQGVHIGGLPPVCKEDHIKKISLQDEWGEVFIWLLPFIKPGYVRGVFPEEEISSYTDAVKKLLEREEICWSDRNILVCHQFFTDSGKEPVRSQSETLYVGGVGNVEISAVEQFDYVAMGHIHKEQKIRKEQFRYCGTPLKYSISESQDKKYLTEVTIGEKGTPPKIEKLPLHPLRDVKCFSGTLKELLECGCDDYVSITLTDEVLPYQPREQLMRVFPKLLEIKVENSVTKKQMEELGETQVIETPAEMFEKFYEEIHGYSLSEKGRGILGQILECAQEDKL